MFLSALNSAPQPVAQDAFLRCCGATAWSRSMTAGRPYKSAAALHVAADAAMAQLSPGDWLEAFAAHPQIGESAHRDAPAANWAKDEQASARDVDAATKLALQQANRIYRAQFGYIFLVCATGLSAHEMLSMLQARLGHAPDVELRVAMREQSKITHLRLDKLVHP